MHAKKSSERAADERDEPERFFADAAAIKLSFHFINANVKKTDYIYQQEID